MTDDATPTTAAELETFTAKGGSITVVPAKEPKAKTRRTAVPLPPPAPPTEEAPTVEPPTAPPAVEAAPTTEQTESTDFAADVRQMVQAWIALHGTPKVAGAIRAAMRPEPKGAKTGAARGAGIVNPLPRGYRFEPDAIVTLLVDANPKKPGSKASSWFSAIMDAATKNGGKTCTVAEAVAAGAPVAEIRYDVEHGFVRVDAATSA